MKFEHRIKNSYGTLKDRQKPRIIQQQKRHSILTEHETEMGTTKNINT